MISFDDYHQFVDYDAQELNHLDAALNRPMVDSGHVAVDLYHLLTALLAVQVAMVVAVSVDMSGAQPAEDIPAVAALLEALVPMVLKVVVRVFLAVVRWVEFLWAAKELLVLAVSVGYKYCQAQPIFPSPHHLALQQCEWDKDLEVEH